MTTRTFAPLDVHHHHPSTAHIPVSDPQQQSSEWLTRSRRLFSSFSQSLQHAMLTLTPSTTGSSFSCSQSQSHPQYDSNRLSLSSIAPFVKVENDQTFIITTHAHQPLPPSSSFTNYHVSNANNKNLYHSEVSVGSASQSQSSAESRFHIPSVTAHESGVHSPLGQRSQTNEVNSGLFLNNKEYHRTINHSDNDSMDLVSMANALSVHSQRWFQSNDNIRRSREFPTLSLTRAEYSTVPSQSSRPLARQSEALRPIYHSSHLVEVIDDTDDDRLHRPRLRTASVDGNGDGESLSSMSSFSVSRHLPSMPSSTNRALNRDRTNSSAAASAVDHAKYSKWIDRGDGVSAAIDPREPLPVYHPDMRFIIHEQRLMDEDRLASSHFVWLK